MNQYKYILFTLFALFSGTTFGHGLSVYGVDKINMSNEECLERARGFFADIGIKESNVKTWEGSVVAKDGEFESYVVCHVDKEYVSVSVSAPASQQGPTFVSKFFEAYRK